MKNNKVSHVLMCRPDFFEVKYSINPWMVGVVDKPKAMKQWLGLVDSYTKLGIDVEVIEQDPGLPDMVFSADCGLVVGKKVVVSNFRFPERRGESLVYGDWFVSRGYEVVEIKNGFFEGGGDSVYIDGKLLIGTGFRNSDNVCRQLARVLDVDVVCLELVDERFFHLDTCLFGLNSETAFWYPEAFSKKSQGVLKGLFDNLIQITSREADNFAANSVVLGNNVIVGQGNDEFVGSVAGLGYKVWQLDVSEFMKAGGGIHCLTNFLERDVGSN